MFFIINSKKFGDKKVLIDPEDFEKISSYKWILLIGRHGNFYARTYLGRKTTFLHKLIYPDYEFVDHINGNGLDNRKSNLRNATAVQNGQNRRKIAKASSIYKGVCWKKESKKWCARITVNKKRIQLGYFKNEKEASKAYNKAALKYFGEFAKIEKVNEYIRDIK